MNKLFPSCPPILPCRGSQLGFSILLSIGALPLFAEAESSDAPPTLTTARGVLGLSTEEASRALPVKIQGVVTLSNPSWSGEFFLQDATAGVFINNLAGPNTRPVEGDLVEVTGTTEQGAFAPIVNKPVWRLLGKSPLPPPAQSTIDELLTGAQDGQTVELEGWVHRVRFELGAAYLDLVEGAERVQVRLPVGVKYDPEVLTGSKVRVRGVPTAQKFGPGRRRIVSVQLWVAVPEHFRIIIPAQTSPLPDPPIAIGELPNYRIDANPGRRYHLKGVVTYSANDTLYISDSSGGIEIRNPNPVPVNAGDVLDAVGFLVLERGNPVLIDAELRPTGQKGTVTPREVNSLQELRDGNFDGNLIKVKGQLINYLESGVNDSNNIRHVTALFKTLDGFFVADMETPASSNDLSKLEVGSFVQLLGVCVETLDQQGSFQSFRLQVPSMDDIQILQHASPFTIFRLLVLLTGACLLLVFIIARSNLLSRRNIKLEGDVREHNAVLAERGRLARDLHDTLEQVLTGVSLQLQTAQRLLSQDSKQAGDHLQIASTGIRQTHAELRRSIWNLTPLALENFDLFEALNRSFRSIAEASNLKHECRSKGQIAYLDPVVEENLLRIGQEAAANSAKHAHATKLTLHLHYSEDSLRIEIMDDGIGFSEESKSPKPSGGFGLSNMKERAGRIGGSLTIKNRHPHGTIIEIDVPLVGQKKST